MIMGGISKPFNKKTNETKGIENDRNYDVKRVRKKKRFSTNDDDDDDDDQLFNVKITKAAKIAKTNELAKTDESKRLQILSKIVDSDDYDEAEEDILDESDNAFDLWKDASASEERISKRKRRKIEVNKKKQNERCELVEEVEEVEEGEEEYMKGSIVKVCVYNWMVFSGPVTLEATGGINLIAAANASGKSSFVCALVFGLGYGSKILSRNKDLLSYIKIGKTESYIEIHLRKTRKEHTVIKRVMKVSDSTVRSHFYVNGVATNVKDMERVQREHNLHIDNLITFLPQENVSKFSRMDPEELFEQTLLAIDKKLLNDYRKIKHYTLLKNDLEIQIHIIEKNILDIQSQVHDLEEKKKKYKAYGYMCDEIKICEIKKRMLLIDMKSEELETLQAELTKVLENKTKEAGTVSLYLLEIEKCHKMIKKLESVTSEKRCVIQEMEELRKSIEEKIMKVEREIKNEETDFKEKMKDILNTKKEIKKLNYEIYKCKERIKDLKEYIERKALTIDQDRDALKKAKEKKKEVNSKMSENLIKTESLKQELSKVQRELKRKSDQACVQEEMLLNNCPLTLRKRIMDFKRDIESFVRRHNLLTEKELSNIKNKYQLVNLHLNEINEEIISMVEKKKILLGPICKYIISKDPQYNHILENFMKKHFTSFLLLDKSKKYILEDLYKRYRLSVLVVEEEEKEKETRICCKVTEEMKRLGVRHFLYELFDSPDYLKRALMHFIPLHSTFILENDTLELKSTEERVQFNNQIMSEIKKQTHDKSNGIIYFNKGFFHKYKISSFNKKVFSEITYRVQTATKYLFHGNEELEKERHELQKRKKQIWEDFQKLDREKYKLTKLSDDLLEEVQRLELEINAQDARPQKINFLKKDIDAAHEKIKEHWNKRHTIDKQFKELIKRIVKLNKEKIRLHFSYIDKLKEHKVLDKEYFKANRNVKLWKKYLKRVKEEHDRCRVEFDKLKNIINDKKEKMRRYTANIRIWRNEIGKQEELLNDEGRIRLHNMDLSYDAIENRIKMLRDEKWAFSYIHNQREGYLDSIVNTLEKHQRDLKSKMNEAQKHREQLQNVEAELNTVLFSWKKLVNEYILFLSFNFNKYMHFINPDYGGIIELKQGIEKDHGKWELDIKVKFKKEGMFLPLSISHQSGGERSLVTMLYILAIQKLTKNSFYVLDELNQGLDEQNETRIFMLLTYLSNPTLYKQRFYHEYDYKFIKINYNAKPQYFIFSPQIIKHIQFDKMTIHFLYNGYGVLEHDQFDDIRNEDESELETCNSESGRESDNKSEGDGTMKT